MIRKKCILMLVLAIIGSLITVSVLFISCDSSEEKGRQTSQKQEEWKQKVKDVKTTLISRHNAIIFPPKGFGKRKVFTYNLQKLLINKDGRPILFDGTLDDITKDNDHFTVHFISYLAKYAEYEVPALQLLSNILDERRVRFHLKCKYEDVESLLDNPPNALRPMDGILGLLYGKEEFCVVCTVTHVDRILHYAVKARPISSEEAEIEIESPDTFSVTGELVEMLKYPEFSEP